MVSVLRSAFAVTSILWLSSLCGNAMAQEDASEPQKVQARPLPAEIMPRAAQALTLAVVNNGKHLMAVGERGHILASNDGVHWAQLAVPVRATLTALTFVDDQVGWAVGHDATILKTEDGGKSWQLQNFEPEKETAFLSVAATDKNHAYAVGAFGLFYATSDGGINWAAVEVPSIQQEDLYFHSIVRLNDGSLFIAGESSMLGVSADGAHWQRLKSPYEGTFFGALPHGAKGALVFGLRGNIYVTEDVRKNAWIKVAIGSEASLYGGSLMDDGRAVLVGLSGEVFVVDSAARHADPVPSGLSFSLCGVTQVKRGLVVVGENGVRRFDASF